MTKKEILSDLINIKEKDIEDFDHKNESSQSPCIFIYESPKDTVTEDGTTVPLGGLGGTNISEALKIATAGLPCQTYIFSDDEPPETLKPDESGVYISKESIVPTNTISKITSLREKNINAVDAKIKP